MKKFGEFICKNKKYVIIISAILLVLSVIGMKLTKVNYDILVYLPEDIETIKGQSTLTSDFGMGSYSMAITKNLSSKEIINLENQIKDVAGVNNVMSLYDAIGTTIPMEMLPNEITEKLHNEDYDILFITFADSTSSEATINAVREIRELADDKLAQGGMSSMVLDTMNLSESEITIYIIIAVLLCIVVLELSLDSYIVPLILLLNIGVSILFNLGTNIFLGEISYITKALVAVLQLGVTTDFSIFLYHSYEDKKGKCKTSDEAMSESIKETFTSVTGSSLTTIAGFLVLCTMELTLGRDLGIVMAKGVLLGVITVLTLFPSLILVLDKLITKSKHKQLVPDFTRFNAFIIKHHIMIFIIFLVLLIPMYKANSKIDVYYKLDKSLPVTLESINTNEILKNDFNIVSPEIILVDKNIKNSDMISMVDEIESLDGIDFVLTFAKIKNIGITENMLNEELVSIFENDKYQMILVNSLYDIATDELNDQTDKLNDIVKKYDKNAIVAGEGPLMKDLVNISDTDFNNVNIASIVCIFVILFFVLKSLSLPFLLIAAIEFAIFTNMALSYFSGDTLPFIAPIVLGTIQLGATIDYAILMTTTYLTHRKNNIEKNEAMLLTMNYSGISILISSMCFFAATFGVGMYSKIEMIGSLCSLISRGAIISMFVVITILPSILLIFDKIIMKTTLNSERRKNMKNKKFKNIGVSLMAISLLLANMPLEALALTKNETVYTKLNSDGTIKNVLVNEQLLNSEQADIIEDYSELKDILNVGNNNKYEINNNLIKWDARGNDIFYQGTTNKETPISVDITYSLDGKEEKLEDILGKSGNVKIIIKYTNKNAHTLLVNGRYETLYTPFVVTMGTIIDSNNNKNITINNGKVVSTGIKCIIAGIAAPGLYESLGLSELYGMDTISISMDTTNFELPTIYSVVTPKIIESSDLEMFNKMDSLYKNVDELQENINKIEDGSKKLVSGSNELKTKLKESIDTLSKDDAPALSEEQINYIKEETVNNVKSTFTENYKTGIANSTWEIVKSEMNPNDETVAGIIKNNVTSGVTEAVTEIMTGYSTTPVGGTKYDECENGSIASCEEIESIKGKITTAITKALTTSNKNTAVSVSQYVAENTTKKVVIDASMQSAIGTAEKISSSLPSQIADTVKNTAKTTMTDSLKTLYEGVSALDEGINNLSNGISKYNSEGINKISNLVNTKVKSTTERIKALTNLSAQYDSFSGKQSNTNGETKFVFVIDSKKKESTNRVVEQKVEKTTLWTRIKNLFK